MSLPTPPPGIGWGETFTLATWFNPSAFAAPGTSEHARAPKSHVFHPGFIRTMPSFCERNFLPLARTNSWRRKPAGDRQGHQAAKTASGFLWVDTQKRVVHASKDNPQHEAWRPWRLGDLGV
jgi:hypothetical protein